MKEGGLDSYAIASRTVGFVMGAKWARDLIQSRLSLQAEPKEENKGHGVCMEKNRERFTTEDYNGCEFDEKYK